MTDTDPTAAPADWPEILAESEADVAAGRIVPGEQVLRELREGLSRLEAEPVAGPN